MKDCTLIVTTTFGLEKVAKRELEDLGFKGFKVSDGKIEFDAGFNDIARLNVSLRTADRVFLKLAEFKALDFDDLFFHVSKIDWAFWIPKNARMTVIAAVTRSQINSERSCQAMVKKAVVEQLKKHYKADWIKESAAEITIKISIFKDMALLALDTTGIGLHKRGYRQQGGEAPIRENLAAALVLLSLWNKDRVLIDPMCGSGTIVIEAAMIARNIAPGLNRSFAAEHWPYIPQKSWMDARARAREAEDKTAKFQIFGYDIEKKHISASRMNAKNAGVLDDIVFARADAKQLKLEHDHGILISNPPYGVKMGTEKELSLLYSALDNLFKKRPDWSVYIITADKEFPKFFTRAKPDHVRKLYNGNIEAGYFQYYGTRPPTK
ncbi:MAG: class I SAM-dependent RNA methyltransferase [Candidatus Omnitrophica bacterium]|nr:class I SAM-dependent RNA methyltransferase [Candidatus Omnitrophota bacterium]